MATPKRPPPRNDLKISDWYPWQLRLARDTVAVALRATAKGSLLDMARPAHCTKVQRYGNSFLGALNEMLAALEELLQPTTTGGLRHAV